MTAVLRLILPLLLMIAPAHATTVYKTVDAEGKVTFSDQPPAASQVAEILHFNSPEPVADHVLRERIELMRQATDRMVADRLAREAARAERRRVNPAPSTTVVYQDSDIWPIYRGRPHRPWVRPPGHRPPSVRPPVHPPQPLPSFRPGNSYPASLVRRHYTGAAAEVFN